MPGCGWSGGREKSPRRKSAPTATPAAKPNSPTTAFKSPPAMRCTMRSGQPRKTRQPIIMKKPSAKRNTGDEPAVGRNSREASAAPKAPRTKPRISGRKYRTGAALCSLSAPAVSRRKQATQTPMLGGLPFAANKSASAPMTAPEATSVRVLDIDRLFL